MALPLPPPPSQGELPVVAPSPPVQRQQLPSKSPEDKLAALRSYRRARGLCDRCAEKWHRGHVCNATVQLHAIQEVWDLFPANDSTSAQLDCPMEDEHVFLAVSSATVSGKVTPRSLQLLGTIQQISVSILIDSGSSNSFISQDIVCKLAAMNLVSTCARVKVANGGIMQCNQILSQAQWSIQGYDFVFDLKILPLHSFDLILGLDWLETFSPMRVHWKHRWLVIPYQGTQILLQGESDVPLQDLLIHLSMSQELPAITEDTDLHPNISTLLSRFSSVFAKPASLPPERSTDHIIPLILGAQPVNIRPYRYPPNLKDEIENQVAEMVRLGIVRPSSSAFNSPVLLVRKKDGTFRFCVDYRYLNALTLKSHFPIPVFEHLMDELHGASWFTTLDLASGYH